MNRSSRNSFLSISETSNPNKVAQIAIRWGREEGEEVVCSTELFASEKHAANPPSDTHSELGITVAEQVSCIAHSETRRMIREQAAMMGVPIVMDVPSTIVVGKC